MFTIQLIQIAVDYERKLEMENEARRNRRPEECADCPSASQSQPKIA